MGKWSHTVRFKHLLTEDESPEAILKSMNSIADLIEKNLIFDNFTSRNDFRGTDELAQGNYLIGRLYDYCDRERIWLS